jgi:endoglucanase
MVNRKVVVGLCVLSCFALACSAAEEKGPLDFSSRQLGIAGYHTVGAAVRASDGTTFHIQGINWYGFETRDAVAHGLYALDYKAILSQIANAGFNTIRIPFSNEMWESNPTVRNSLVSACPDCKGKSARNVLALIINHAGSLGLHVILDNHRSGAGNSAESNGLWYTSSYPESAWIRDWRDILAWVNGSNAYANPLNFIASDDKPIVLGLDLRNEPHTAGNGPSASYLGGATWGSGDGIDPTLDPNPNPFAPACVTADANCHDWRLAAERVGTTLMGDAVTNGWPLPLLFVEGVGRYPSEGTTPADNVTDSAWWGAMLRGARGNATNPGAPVVFNAGGTAAGLGPAVDGQLVYSAHDYGPDLSAQPWFDASTCYASGCGAASLSDVWYGTWAYLTVDVAPVWPGHATYPWGNTGHSGYTATPVFVGEFGTGNDAASVLSSGAGSQGQWFTDLVNFIAHSRTGAAANDPGVAIGELGYAYWSLNGEDSYGLLSKGYGDVSYPDKLHTFLCALQENPEPGCHVGALPAPDGSLPPPSTCTSDVECSDGNACNGLETCDLGSGDCVPGTPVVCPDDGDPCTQEACVEPAGTCSSSNVCPLCRGNRAPCSSAADCCSGSCKNGSCRGG